MVGWTRRAAGRRGEDCRVTDDEASVAGARAIKAAPHLVLHVRGQSVAEGRRARRARILAMTPTDPTEVRLVARTQALPTNTVHWEYVRPDGVAIMVRARDQADLSDAHRDAARLFRPEPHRLRILYVRGRANAQLSWWIVNDREAVLVAPQVWATSRSADVERHARAALAALQAPVPLWRAYGDPPSV